MKEIGNQIGSNLPRGTMQFTLFVPSNDRAGRAIKQEKWVTEALKVLGKLFRGATAFPPGRGVWRDDEHGGKLAWDEPVMVVSYANPKDVNDHNLATLRHFLHQMGREARQGEIGIVIDGAYYGISDYDA